MIITNNDIFMVHLISTSIMVGLIWLIQVVHYPSFLFIDIEKYSKFQKFHMSRISYVVIPIMMIELLSGVYLFLFYTFSIYLIIELFILAITWILTGLFFSRMHTELVEKFNKNIINKMINLNWFRTCFWSIRLVILMNILM